jgi:hypothetical protein
MVLARLHGEEEVGIALGRANPGAVQPYSGGGVAQEASGPQVFDHVGLRLVRCWLGHGVMALVDLHIKLDIPGAAASAGMADCGLVLRDRDRSKQENNCNYVFHSAVH